MFLTYLDICMNCVHLGARLEARRSEAETDSPDDRLQLHKSDGGSRGQHCSIYQCQQTLLVKCSKHRLASARQCFNVTALQSVSQSINQSIKKFTNKPIITETYTKTEKHKEIDRERLLIKYRESGNGCSGKGAHFTNLDELANYFGKSIFNQK